MTLDCAGKESEGESCNRKIILTRGVHRSIFCHSTSENSSSQVAYHWSYYNLLQLATSCMMKSEVQLKFDRDVASYLIRCEGTYLGSVPFNAPQIAATSRSISVTGRMSRHRRSSEGI